MAFDYKSSAWLRLSKSIMRRDGYKCQLSKRYRKNIPAELVLIAAGVLGSESYLTKAFGVEVDGRTNIATADGTQQTNVKNVFAAGDVRRGQSLVVWAIREGRDVAREVDKSLMEYTNL